MEFSLLFSALIGVMSMWLMLRWEAARGNAAECTKDLWDIALMAGLAGILVGRLAAMIGDGVNPLTNPGDIVIIRGGVSTGWAASSAIAIVAWRARNEFWLVSDGLAAAALAGLAGWQAGCLTRDACLGTPTDLPWAQAQSGSQIGRHPVELYAAIGFAVGAVGLAWWKARGRPGLGVPAGLALATAGGVRLASEPFRPSLSNGPVAWYLAALVVGLGVALWRWRLAVKEKQSAG